MLICLPWLNIARLCKTTEMVYGNYVENTAKSLS